MAKALTIRTVINGQAQEHTVPVHRTLADFLRRDLGMTGTKVGCDTGDCGACTILMDGLPVVSCLVLAVEADGHELRTVEGLGGGELHPLQQSFVDEGAIQCGYCTPGMLMAALALLDDHPTPDAGEVRSGLAGNLCRCTGYARIVEAVMTASKKMTGEGAR